MRFSFLLLAFAPTSALGQPIITHTVTLDVSHKQEASGSSFVRRYMCFSAGCNLAYASTEQLPGQKNYDEEDDYWKKATDWVGVKIKSITGQ